MYVESQVASASGGSGSGLAGTCERLLAGKKSHHYSLDRIGVGPFAQFKLA
jgi:hypothetical protein